MNIFKKSTVSILIVSIACMGMPFGSARAEIIPTEKIAISGDAQTLTARERVDALLAREDVRAALEKNGVDPEQAKARVDALSDEELQEFAAHLDTLPAGSGILGLIFVTFIILLVTDILGFTKVFPFTRSVK